jgi:nitric oxide reductase subunit C
MLSKSQAKAFFLFGTAVCTAAFIGLTLDTFQRIPAQTKSQNLTPEIIRGKHLWDKNNCMGCHTLMGEGAYYAPELTKVYERRGETFVKSMLKDPQKMYPNDRKMVNYNFTDEEISDLTLFLKWIGEMDLNGFPAKPDLQGQGAVTSTAVSESVAGNVAKPAVFTQICVACHAVQGQGGTVGPALDGVGSKFDSDYLAKWISDPASVKPDSKMPKLPLKDSEISELVTYLSQLKGGK